MLEPICFLLIFFLPTFWLPAFRPIPFGAFVRPRFLDEAVQGDQVLVVKAERHPRWPSPLRPQEILPYRPAFQFIKGFRPLTGSLPAAVRQKISGIFSGCGSSATLHLI
jgi:hypothetical protein